MLSDRRTVGARQLVSTLQSTAGNRAITLALQRAGGWPDAATAGPAWNDARAKPVGRITRLAIAGLAGGAGDTFKGGDSQHSSEAADHRAIVLIPQGFSPKDPVDVLLYFHGHTEVWRGRYAGMRQRTFKPSKDTKKAQLTSDNTVRDVDLDQIEQQMDSSDKRQTIGILAQGGPQHQFGDINVDAYISDVLTRTNKEYPTILTAVPKSWSVILSGHSGGGFAVQDALSAANKPKNLKGLILFDAEAMQRDMRRRITEDLDFLADPTHTDADRDAHLAGRPSVRAFTTAGSTYAGRYQDIVTATIESTMKRIFPAGRKAELATPANPTGDGATHRCGERQAQGLAPPPADRPSRPGRTPRAACPAGQSAVAPHRHRQDGGAHPTGNPSGRSDQIPTEDSAAVSTHRITRWGGARGNHSRHAHRFRQLCGGPGQPGKGAAFAALMSVLDHHTPQLGGELQRVHAVAHDGDLATGFLAVTVPRTAPHARRG